MTARRRLNVGFGTAGATRSYPTEAGYVESIKRQTKSMTDRLIDIMNQFKDVSEDLMVEALQPTFEKSQMYCPIDTGALRASGYLEKAGFRGNPRVEIGYARGGQPDYAVRVHENMEWNHAIPTRAKWLQAAVLEDTDAIYDRLGRLYKGWGGF